MLPLVDDTGVTSRLYCDFGLKKKSTNSVVVEAN